MNGAIASLAALILYGSSVSGVDPAHPIATFGINPFWPHGPLWHSLQPWWAGIIVLVHSQV